MNSASKAWKTKHLEALELDVLYRKGRTGLGYAICPIKGCATSSAGFGVKFGGAWQAYSVGGQMYSVPDGTAHYLEHVLFKSGGVNYADLFSARGAISNAETGMFRTSYYFDCVSGFAANLRDLSRMVLRTDIRDEVVEGERGIILAEYFQSRESPYANVFTQLLGAMLGDCNFSRELTGTEGSIREMNGQLLARIHQHFYTPKTIMFGAAGNIDPQECFEMVEDAAQGLSNCEATDRETGVSDSIASKLVTMQDNVARPFVTIGWRIRLPKGNEFERRANRIAISIALESLFGDESQFKQDAVDSGMADDMLDFSAEFGPGIGVLAVGSSSEVPDKLARAIKGLPGKARKNPAWLHELVEILKRKSIGSAIAAATSAPMICSVLHQSRNGKFPPRHTNVEVMLSLTADDILSRFFSLVEHRHPATVVCYPKE